MDNLQLSSRVKRLAVMMQLLGENPYKIRAFEKAADMIAAHPEQMGVLIDEDRLRQIKGIGESLEKVILHYTKSGMSSLELDLEKRLPPGLPELLDLPGLGREKVSILWKKYGITTTESLRDACATGALNSYAGFGEKHATKILEALDFKDKHRADFLLSTALEVASVWMTRFTDSFPNHRFELTGTLRRIDKLAQTVDILTNLPLSNLTGQFTEAEIKNEGEGAFIQLPDPSGLTVRIWSVEDQGFGLGQLIHTGGEVYLPLVKKAIERKHLYTPSETNEAELCQELGLTWVEPEMRDLFTSPPIESDTLITANDIRGVFHAHSTWSDGSHSLEEMAGAVADAGYQYFGISEHSQAAYYANGLQPERVKAQWARIDELNEKYPGLHLFKGIEADILKDGRLDYDEDLLAGFDFVIASIHSHFHLDSRTQTERLIRALQSPFTTMLGHPTGRMLLAREGYAPDMTAVIDAAAEYGKIIEINTTPKRLDLDWRHLPYAKEQGVRISINPDAHRMTAIQTIPLGVMIARKAGLTTRDVINTRGVDDVKTCFEETRKP